MKKIYVQFIFAISLFGSSILNAQLLYSEPFTSSLGSTSAANGSSGNWIWSNSCARSGLSGHTTTGHALFSGAGCQFGNGGNTVSGDLTTPAVAIGPLGAILSFNYSIQNECSGGSNVTCTYDVLSLQVSTNGGASYTTLLSSNASPAGLAVNQTGWIAASYTLNAATYGNQNVLIRFNFNSLDGAANAYDGIYVDDINVIGIQPCSGTPGTNTILPSTTLVCPGYGNSMLNLANGYTTGGLQYTWLIATQSAVGPYTPINNATLTAYPTTTLNQVTYYQAVITCTNSNLSFTTDPVTINVASVTISQIPYLEDFEGITFTNQLPNCSWSATSPTTVARTYTSTQTQGRTARSGSKFASFYYSPSGTNSFYTNGIQMYAGVTYSASVWYATNYYGDLNWSNISMYVAPNQSATNQTLIASSNGPAASAGYKAMSNTFTVATSGIYYVSIKGTSNGGCCAYHLNWDDLRIEIPCSLNTPSVSLSANNTTICAGDPVVLTATGADTYNWGHGGTGNQVTVYPPITDVYTVIGTHSLSGCQSVIQSQQIVVNPLPQLNVVAVPPIVCAGSPAVLTGVGATTYTWSGNNGNNNFITVSPTVTTTYSVFGGNIYGCQTQTSQVIVVNNLPNVSGISDRPEICRGESAVLTGNGAVSYEWAASTLFIQSPLANVSPNITTTYTLTGTNSNGCKKSTTVLLTVMECVGVNEMTTTLAGVKIYPNPTGGEFTVELGNDAKKTIEVTDVTGRVVFSNNTNAEAINVSIADFANGIYYVKIQSQIAVEVIKVIKN